jgi:hypothetical protein
VIDDCELERIEMMISSALIEKWKKMLKHQDVLHVTQGEGQFYSVDEIKGYYNDLRGKVERTTTLDKNGIPYNIAAQGEKKKRVYFPISIFQYGLGAYDMYLEKDEQKYREIVLRMADWAVKHQQADGSWDTFGVLGYKNHFSSMAQGEGASLLARAYKETKDEKYLSAMEKAIDFMLTPLKDGGTTEETEKESILYEYPGKAAVLNGWIFSAFGLLDAWKATGEEKYREAWEKTLTGIKSNIKRFDTGHWSFYDWGGKYTSPFYHSLHIAQLTALNKLNPDSVWTKYIEKWKDDQDSKFWRRYAFLMKAKQKVFEKKSAEWVLVG